MTGMFKMIANRTRHILSSACSRIAAKRGDDSRSDPKMSATGARFITTPEPARSRLREWYRTKPLDPRFVWM
jgi:hypothetical protein